MIERRHIQKIGAALSRRDWQATETAYNELRDEFDRATPSSPDVELQRGKGWVFWNPDSGEEYSPNHPVESGECDDAESIRKSTPQEDALWAAVQEQFTAREAAEARALSAVKALEEAEADIRALDAFPPSIQSQSNIRIINAFDSARATLQSIRGGEDGR